MSTNRFTPIMEEWELLAQSILPPRKVMKSLVIPGQNGGMVLKDWGTRPMGGKA